MDRIIGIAVSHNEFGNGTIVGFDKNVVSVYFDKIAGVKRFIFPDCFIQHLSVNGQDSEHIKGLIENTQPKQEMAFQEKKSDSSLRPHIRELILKSPAIGIGRPLGINRRRNKASLPTEWATHEQLLLKGYTAYHGIISAVTRRTYYLTSCYHHYGESGYYVFLEPSTQASGYYPHYYGQGRTSLVFRIKMDEKPFCGAAVFDGHISVNIYDEVLSITRYSRFSSKLYAALSRNVGKDIVVYVKDVQNIWIDIRPYFPLDYNYMY